MLESQARRQVQYKNDKEIESTFGKWTLSQAVSFLYQFFYCISIQLLKDKEKTYLKTCNSERDIAVQCYGKSLPMLKPNIES